MTYENSTEKIFQYVLQQTTKFVVIGQNLYRRGYSAPLQKCIGEEDTENILIEVHEGVYGSHVKSKALANILLR